ncbi:hypothetical protein ACFL3E_01385 [Patescibacteria group bacterium]
MKHAIATILVAVVFLGGCTAMQPYGSSRIATRTSEGMILGGLGGAAIGAATGRKEAVIIGAGAGALAGAVVGAVVGVGEEGAVRQEPLVLGPLQNKTVFVCSGRSGYNREAVSAVIIDQLRERGANIVMSVRSQRCSRSGVKSDFVAVFESQRRGPDAVVDLFIVPHDTEIILFFGQGRWPRGRRQSHLAYENAAHQAVKYLH